MQFYVLLKMVVLGAGGGETIIAIIVIFLF